MFLICTLSTAPKHPKWAYGIKRKTPYFVEIQRFIGINPLSLWCHRDSNQGHKDFQSFALPTELWHHRLSLLIASAKVGNFFLLPNFFKEKFYFFTIFVAVLIKYLIYIMILTWLILIIGFIMITSGATWLTNGSAAVAQRLKISEYIIGMTIVAVGTSLPELTVSVASTFAGSADMAIGNIVGSNIFNTLFILGICALIRPVSFTRNNLRVDIWLCLAVTIALVAMLWGGRLSRVEGIAMVLCYIAVLYFSIKLGKKEVIEEDTPQENSNFSWLKSLLLIILGFVALVYGANITLDSAISIARNIGISERVIGITLLAGGTSLPELAASLVAVARGHGALALGNVIGSNIANILLILGSCATISPLAMGGITYIDLGVIFGSAMLLAISARLFGHRVITRMEAVVFLAAYVLYIWYLID